jgi:hypothetical protein
MILLLKIIKVKDWIASPYAVSTEDGEALFEVVKEFIEQGLSLTLDFSEIDVLTTAFLTSSIGELSVVFSSDVIETKLVLSGLDEPKLDLIKEVKNRAKEYSLDPKKFEDFANNSFYGI